VQGKEVDRVKTFLDRTGPVASREEMAERKLLE
jgi:hypothetical protein